MMKQKQQQRNLRIVNKNFNALVNGNWMGRRKYVNVDEDLGSFDKTLLSLVQEIIFILP